MKKNIIKKARFMLAVFMAFSSICIAQQPKTHTVTLKADGSFEPQRLFIHDGDTVVWQFHERTDTIIPVDSTGPPGSFCSAYKPYDPADPNEFTGPLPRAASGIFTLGPDGRGFVIETRGGPNPSCDYDQAPTKVGDQYLCNTGERFATMDWTWRNPNITGVFIRLRWNTVHLGPGVFDWSVMDREIEKAVRNGKMYSLSFKAGSKGTPDWIFDPAIAGSEAVKPLVFQDTGDNPGPGECGVTMTLGSPADPNYRKHYFDVWRAAAQHIREKNAWYRALAYVKPSGANLFSHENRLPNRCEPSCTICNPQVWAEQGGYTPTALYEFYSEQTALLASEFPGKDMSYALIQAGFPLVNDQGEYKEPLTAPLPGGTEQTETILMRGQNEHGLSFVVQHNGLGIRPQDKPMPGAPCPNEGIHPAVPPFARAGSGCPNKWVLRAGATQVTGFQTNNAKGVANPIELESALRNAWDNSDAIFLEIYEQRLWEAETAGPVLDPNATGRTIGEWTEAFHKRRRDFWAGKLPDPFPMSHRHTFKRTIASTTENQLFYYINGSKCDAGSSVNYGVIVVLPDNIVSVENEELTNVPKEFELGQNYPNPFNPSTTINYSVEKGGEVELRIYNLRGQIVRTLVQGNQPAGDYSAGWDGRDDAGRLLSSGQYFYRLQVGETVQTRRMLFLK